MSRRREGVPSTHLALPYQPHSSRTTATAFSIPVISKPAVASPSDSPGTSTLRANSVSPKSDSMNWDSAPPKLVACPELNQASLVTSPSPMRVSTSMRRSVPRFPQPGHGQLSAPVVACDHERIGVTVIEGPALCGKRDLGPVVCHWVDLDGPKDPCTGSHVRGRHRQRCGRGGPFTGDGVDHELSAPVPMPSWTADASVESTSGCRLDPETEGGLSLCDHGHWDRR